MIGATAGGDLMKRQLVLGVLLVIGAASIGVAARQQPAGGAQPAARVVDVDKLKDNLYVMRNGGGNSAVFIMADGVTVVDTKNPGWGQPLLDKIKSVTDKPIVRIDRKSTRLNSSHSQISYAVFCLKKKMIRTRTTL